MIEPQINEAQQQQDIQTMQQGIETSEVPSLDQGVEVAGIGGKFGAWAARKIIKETTPSPTPKPKKQLFKELNINNQVEIPEGMQPKPQLEHKPIAVEKAEIDLKPKDLDEYDLGASYQPNFDTIETSDDVKAVIAEMAVKNAEQITEARRGVLGDEQLKLLAKDLGEKPDFIQQVMNRNHGELMTPEHILATRQVLEQSAIRLKKLSMLVRDGRTDPSDEALDTIDKINLAFGKQYQFHKQFMNEFMGMRAEFGRGLRAFGIQNKNSIEADLIKEQMQYVQSGLDIQTMAKQIADAPTTEGVTGMVKAQDGWLRKSGNVFLENFINSILSGVKTHVVNVTGSSLRLGMDVLDTAVAARIGKDLPNDEDKLLADEWKAQVFGLMSGFNDALAASWTTMKTAEPYGGSSKLDVGAHKAISGEYLGLRGIPGTVADALGTIIRFPTERLMGAEDAFFKKLTERGTISQLAYREANKISVAQNLSKEESLQLLEELITNPTEEMLAEANEKALTVTFQKPLGEFGQKVQNITYGNYDSNLANALSFGASYIMPFIKTPSNLLKEAFFERNPLITPFTTEYKKAIQEGGARGQMARAKLYVGTAVSTFAGMMAYNGSITGSDPSDPKEREIKHSSGWRPYSFYDGENYYSYQRFEPFSYMLSSIADFADVMRRSEQNLLGEEDEQYASRIAASWAIAVSNSTLDRSFMTGLRDIMNVASDPKRYMPGYLANQVNANIPFSGMRRDVARMFDDTKKLTGSFLDRIKANTPGFNEGMPNQLDALGEPIEFDAVLNPFPVVDKKDDIIWNEVSRLSESTRKSALSKMSGVINGVKLKPQEYYDLVKLARKDLEVNGMNLRAALEDLISSPEYDALIDEYKVNQIAKVKQGFDKAAKLMILERNPELLERVVVKKNARNIKQQSKMTGMTEEELKQDMLMQILRGGN